MGGRNADKGGKKNGNSERFVMPNLQMHRIPRLQRWKRQIALRGRNGDKGVKKNDSFVMLNLRQIPRLQPRTRWTLPQGRNADKLVKKNDLGEKRVAHVVSKPQQRSKRNQEL